MKLALLALVGPSDVEVDRLRRVLRSAFAYSASITEVVLIDDVLDPRPLDEVCAFPGGVRCTVLTAERMGRPPAVLGGLSVGLLQGLRWLADNCDVDAVIKIDTDALVIGSLDAKIEALLASEPQLATAGVVELNCDGTRRSWEPFGDVTRHLAMFFRLKRHGLLKRRIALFNPWRTVRSVLVRARRNGYAWGEHSQGGAYLVSRALIDCMKQRGYLNHGSFWHAIFMTEDVMLGIYARACNLKNVDAARAGGIFGVTHQGLPLTPAELVTQDYAIAHCVKNDARLSEAEVNRFFEERLPSSAA